MVNPQKKVQKLIQQKIPFEFLFKSRNDLQIGMHEKSFFLQSNDVIFNFNTFNWNNFNLILMIPTKDFDAR